MEVTLKITAPEADLVHSSHTYTPRTTQGDPKHTESLRRNHGEGW